MAHHSGFLCWINWNSMCFHLYVYGDKPDGIDQVRRRPHQLYGQSVVETFTEVDDHRSTGGRGYVPSGIILQAADGGAVARFTSDCLRLLHA